MLLGLAALVGLLMPASALIAAESGALPHLDCSGGAPPIVDGNLTLAASACQSEFGGQYGTWVSNGGYWTNGSYNFSYGVPLVAEVDPAGHLVAVGNFLASWAGNTSSTFVAAENGTDLRATYSTNVTNASGLWAANDSWGAPASDWSFGSAGLGTAILTLVWHVRPIAQGLQNGSYRLKLDIDVMSWPWQAAGDELGVLFTGLAPGGSHFAYNDSNSTLSEYWNGPGGTNSTGGNGSGGAAGTGAWFFGLQWANNASTDAGSTGGVAAVNVSTLLYAGQSAATPRGADVLLTFQASQRNYTALRYDPWMEFATPGPGSSLVRTPHHPTPTQPPPAFVLPTGSGIVLVAVAVAIGAGGVVLARARRLRPPDALAPLGASQ